MGKERARRGLLCNDGVERNFRGDNACVRMRNVLPTKNQQGEHHLPKLGKNLVCLKNRKKLE